MLLFSLKNNKNTQHNTTEYNIYPQLIDWGPLFQAKTFRLPYSIQIIDDLRSINMAISNRDSPGEPETEPDPIKVFPSIFWEHKCGLEGTGERFFKWCNETKFETSVKTRCNDIAGVPGRSELSAQFFEKSLPSRSSYGQLGLNIEIFKEDNLVYSFRYSYLRQDEIEKMKDYCDKQLKASSFPIWAIVLVTLLALTVLASTAFFSWKYRSSKPSSGSKAFIGQQSIWQAPSGIRASPRRSKNPVR